ncbi:MAG: hypothetical protein JO270_22725 [Acidobacteriaceae bacterium]|nr:hypothetical protein [Acidobacteriaceae bacterium]MBV8570277.1 hypothetical protein [Acidobacteriaceae bacterium]
MDQNTLLILLIIFVAVSAVALLIQGISLLGMFIVARDLRNKIMPLWPEIQHIVGTTRRTVERTASQVEKIGASSVEIMNVSKQQLAKVDELLTDTTTRAKVQLERAEMVMDDTMTRVQDTVVVVQRGVLRPIREVQGVLAGFRTAIHHLGRGGRPTVDHATSDEEMFI